MSSGKGDKGSAKPVRLRPRAPCPICGKASVQRYHPFCSLRCADVDLSRWLSGRYAVPVADPGDDDDPDPPDPVEGLSSASRTCRHTCELWL